MEGNLNEQEEGYLGRILSELKMNFVDEKKKGDDLPEEDTKKEPSEEPKKEKPKKTTKKKTAAKKTTAKSKEKK